MHSLCRSRAIAASLWETHHRPVLTDSDTDIVAIVRLEGSGHVQQRKEHFLSFGHREFCKSLFECLRRAEGIEVLHTFPHKNRISFCVKGASADVLPALPPESLSFEDLRMDEPGVWIKTYSLNVFKCSEESVSGTSARSCSTCCQIDEVVGSRRVPSRIDSFHVHGRTG